jgi:hypothetical protein
LASTLIEKEVEISSGTATLNLVPSATLYLLYDISCSDTSCDLSFYSAPEKTSNQIVFETSLLVGVKSRPIQLIRAPHSKLWVESSESSATLQLSFIALQPNMRAFSYCVKPVQSFDLCLIGDKQAYSLESLDFVLRAQKSAKCSFSLLVNDQIIKSFKANNNTPVTSYFEQNIVVTARDIISVAVDLDSSHALSTTSSLLVSLNANQI